MSRPPSPYGPAALPRIDYARHPAYGAVKAPAVRAAALWRFLGGLTVTSLRWITDSEHLPKPPEGASRMAWMARNAPRLLIGAIRHTLARFGRRAGVPKTGRDRAVADALRDDGVFVFRLSEAERTEMARLTAGAFDALEARLASGVTQFDDNRLWIDEAADPEPYRWFRALLERAGVIGGSRARLGRPVTVAHLIPQINTPETDFWTGQFRDVGLPDPACNYCHVDTAWGITKMIIYLGAVGPDNGPFSYVRGSHRARDGFPGRLVRKANDHAGLSSTRPEMRRLFAALPRGLQRKAAFGPDVEDAHPLAGALLAAEWRITSDQGDAILFDPDGVHRGGMVRSGQRRVIGVLLAET